MSFNLDRPYADIIVFKELPLELSDFDSKFNSLYLVKLSAKLGDSNAVFIKAWFKSLSLYLEKISLNSELVSLAMPPIFKCCTSPPLANFCTAPPLARNAPLSLNMSTAGCLFLPPVNTMFAGEIPKSFCKNSGSPGVRSDLLITLKVFGSISLFLTASCKAMPNCVIFADFTSLKRAASSKKYFLRTANFSSGVLAFP